MDRYHPALKDLAPRDEVSRAIYYEMEQSESTYVLLDTSLLKVDPQDRFPSIHETCLEAGIDMTREPIPVVPAAHYFCGGVKTDMEGRTTIRGSTRPGRPPAPGSTGRTVWPRFPCSRACVFGLAGRKGGGRRDRSPGPAPRPEHTGLGLPGRGGGGGSHPRLPRPAEYPDDHVGLRRESSAPASAWPGPRPT
ncbi:MAG: FAD-binding protein [Candidatus Moduliflexus flocculans]|nr:FAD-binding protein [Candidatus Moduliflexus flocculans]